MNDNIPPARTPPSAAAMVPIIGKIVGDGRVVLWRPDRAVQPVHLADFTEERR